MNLSKIIGWLVFSVGIIIIGSTLYFTYNVFTGNATTPEVFKAESISQESTQEQASGLEGELQRMLSEQLENLIPLDSIIKFSNLAVWTIGAWILIMGGGKISELGIKLIRIPSHQES